MLASSNRKVVIRKMLATLYRLSQGRLKENTQRKIHDSEFRPINNLFVFRDTNPFDNVMEIYFYNEIELKGGDFINHDILFCESNKGIILAHVGEK